MTFVLFKPSGVLRCSALLFSLWQSLGSSSRTGQINVMLLLLCDIFPHFLQIRHTHGKRCVSTLPRKFFKIRVLRLQPHCRPTVQLLHPLRLAHRSPTDTTNARDPIVLAQDAKSYGNKRWCHTGRPFLLQFCRSSGAYLIAFFEKLKGDWLVINGVLRTLR
jgi:hypothetical protein